MKSGKSRGLMVLLLVFTLLSGAQPLFSRELARAIPEIEEFTDGQLKFAAGLDGWTVSGTGPAVIQVQNGQQLAVPAGGALSLPLTLSRGSREFAGRRYLLRFTGKIAAPGVYAYAVFSGRKCVITSTEWQDYELITDTEPFFPGVATQTADLAFGCGSRGGTAETSGRLFIKDIRLFHVPSYGLQLRYNISGTGKFAGEVYIIRRHRDKNSKDGLQQRFHASIPLPALPAGQDSAWVDLRRHLFGAGEATLCLKLWPQGRRAGSGQVTARIEFASHLMVSEKADENKTAPVVGNLFAESAAPELSLEEPDTGAAARKKSSPASVIFAREYASANGFFTFMVPESEMLPRKFVATLRPVADDAATRHKLLPGMAAADKGAGRLHIPVGANLSALELILDPDSIRRELEILAHIGITSTARNSNAPIGFDAFRQARYPSQSYRDRTYAGRVEYREFANPELSPYNGDRLEQYMDNKYAKLANRLQAGATEENHIEIVELFDEPPNLGIVAQDLDEFRRFLREDFGLTPEALGATDWTAVLPEGFSTGTDAPSLALPAGPDMEQVLEDSAAGGEIELDVAPVADSAADALAGTAELTLEQRRLRYYTRLFCARKTADYFRTVTGAVEKHLPGVKTAVNFRAGIRRVLTPETADWFRIGRDKAVTMMWNEDWLNTYGWRQNGIQLVSYYTELMRAAGRRQQLPAGGFLMCYWGEAELKSYAALAHGSRYLHYWRYGPAYANYLPYSWSHNPRVVQAVSQVCRDLERIGGCLAEAERTTPAVALLYAKSDPLWGRAQTENRLVFLALLHDQIPVDIITEDEIEEDEILRKYSVLYVTDVAVRARTQEKIAGWLGAGGALWLSGAAATRDEINSVCDILYGKLGVSLTGPGGGIVGIDCPTDAPQVRQACGLAPGLRGETVLKFTDGTPAMINGRYGKGIYTVCAFRAGELYEANVRPNFNRENGKGQIQKGWSSVRRGWINSLALTEAKFRRPVELNRACIEAVMYRHPEQDMLFLINFSGEYTDQPLFVEVKTGAEIQALESLRRGALAYTKTAEGISFTLPLDRADIVIFKK